MMQQAVLLLVVALQFQVGSSSVNLVPHWQFPELSKWKQSAAAGYDLETQLIRWTDGRFVRALKCTEKYHKGCYACWAWSEMIPVNPSLAYEFSIYMASTGRDVHNYFGFIAYDCTKRRIDMAPWNETTYFKNTKNDGSSWNRWNGYILPSYIPDYNNNGLADHQSSETNGRDWIWSEKACYVRLRFGSCYGDGLGRDRTYFVFPSVKEVTTDMDLLEERLTYLKHFKYLNIMISSDWITKPNIGGAVFVNGQYTYVHKSVESGTRCYEWAVSPKFLVDRTRKYEFSIWILSTGTDIHNYLGFFVYNNWGIQIATGTLRNPYFKSSKNDPPEWVRWNGFILPSTFPSSPSDPNKPQDVPSYLSKGVDWKFPSNADSVAIRFGSCYGDGDNQGTSFFALPKINQLDFQL